MWWPVVWAFDTKATLNSASWTLEFSIYVTANTQSEEKHKAEDAA